MNVTGKNHKHSKTKRLDFFCKSKTVSFIKHIHGYFACSAPTPSIEINSLSLIKLNAVQMKLNIFFSSSSSGLNSTGVPKFEKKKNKKSKPPHGWQVGSFYDIYSFIYIQSTSHLSAHTADKKSQLLLLCFQNGQLKLFTPNNNQHPWFDWSTISFQ